MESDMNTANIFSGFLRMLASGLDRVLFGALQLIYRLFFSVASTDIISGVTVAKFFSRIQLILGVFMLFQLAVIILKGIVDPDSFTNEKSGAGNFIVKVITSLLILTVLVPINFAGANNEYQKQVSTHGLLFGTLYSLQNRILANNTIGRLVLGEVSSTNGSSSAAGNDPSTAARIFTTSVIKGFYRINLKPEEQRTTPTDGREAYMIKSNRVCQNYDYSKYLKTDAKNDDIISMIQESCITSGGKKYVIAYSPLSIVAAVLFIFIFASFCMDVVVRSAKLAFLRLLAPIPVISYMDPNGSKDNMFNSWTKTLVSTYIDLFVRLAAIYFVLFLVTELLSRGTYSSTGGYGIIGWIIISLGLLNFARQAPKFVSEMLGIKGLGSFRLFGGLSDLRATGSMVIAPVTGAVGGAVVGKSVGGKIWGGVSGFFGGGRNAAGAYFSNADKPLSVHDVDNARLRYREQQYSRANDGSTFWGRFTSGLKQQAGLRTKYEEGEIKKETFANAKSSMTGIENQLFANRDNNMAVAGYTYDDGAGHNLLNSSFTYENSSGKMVTVLSAGTQVDLKAVHEAVLQLEADNVPKDSADYKDLKALEDAMVQQKLKLVGAGLATKDERNLDLFVRQFITTAVTNSSSDEFSAFAGMDFDTAMSRLGGSNPGDIDLKMIKKAGNNAGTWADWYEKSPDRAKLKSDDSRATENNRGGGGH